MKKHWRLHSNLKIIGYSELSLTKNAHMLDEINPDLIILDECYSVHDLTAGRTRRLNRWFKEHPETMCIAMSGTSTKRSIKNFAHIAHWCLKENTPLPTTWSDLNDWALALDADVPCEQILAPGALQRFCFDGDNVRQGFQRRLVETPGVVSSKTNDQLASIRITKFEIETPADIQKTINQVRRTWETPDGDIIMEAVHLWRYIRELSLGFYYRWNPPAPKGWLAVRRQWQQFVRDTLQHNRRGLDTELQVWNECVRANTNLIWQNWNMIKNSFKPKTEAVWINNSFVVSVVIRWASKRDNGIIWVENPVVGEHISKQLGISFFGAGDSEALIHNKAPFIVLSIGANLTGKNLERFSENLILSPPAAGDTWEQLIGRTHRPKQTADVVTFDVLAHQPELLESFKKALNDARYHEDLEGMKQKLSYADIDPRLR